MVNLDTYKFWQVALREVYHLGFINDVKMIAMSGRDYYLNIDNHINDKQYIMLVIDVMNNVELFKTLILEEMKILIKSELPTDKRKFKKIWLGYLIEVRENLLITPDEFDTIKPLISFDNDKWEPSESEHALYIIDKIRTKLVKNKPNAGQYFENVSFDMLMAMNELSECI